MPLWTEDQFIARAKDIAREHAATRSPLNDLVEKTARDCAMGPDEIRTLGRLTNVAVFQEMFQGKTASAAPDRMVEFEPGDPEVVITRIVKAASSSCAPVAVKTASYSADLPDLMRAVRRPEQSAGSESEKVASEPSEREAPAVLRLMRLRKLADNLDVEVKIAGARWESTIDELTRRFRKAPGYGPSFLDFEKDAMAAEGFSVAPELAALREALRLPAVSMAAEKVAALQERRIYEDSEELRLLKKAAAQRAAYVTLRNGKSEVTARLAAEAR